MDKLTKVIDQNPPDQHSRNNYRESLDEFIESKNSSPSHPDNIGDPGKLFADKLSDQY